MGRCESILLAESIQATCLVSTVDSEAAKTIGILIEIVRFKSSPITLSRGAERLLDEALLACEVLIASLCGYREDHRFKLQHHEEPLNWLNRFEKALESLMAPIINNC